MHRLGAVFAAAGGAAVAAAAGAGLAASLPVAVVGGLAGAGFGTACVLAWAGRRALRQAAARREALTAAVVGIAKRLAALEPRLVEVEQALGQRAEQAVVDRELGELGALLRLIAEQVEGHDLLLGTDGRADAPGAAVAPRGAAMTPLPSATPPRREAPAMSPRPAATAAPASASPAVIGTDAGTRLRDALRRGAVDLNLRAVVALPQRRTLHYEAVAQFRDRAGKTLGDGEVAAAVSTARLGGAVDAVVIERTMRVARRLRERQRDVAVFVTLSPQSWGGEPSSLEVVQRLHAGVDLARHIVLQIAAPALRGLAAAERDLLAGLHQKGYRFAATGLDNLNVDARGLHAMGVRFIKVAPQLLLSADSAAKAEIHPDDLSDFLKRHNITLIADPVERESTVAELLDMNVAAVQGPLFGAPRPVRAEVLAGQGPPPPEPNVGEGLGLRVARQA
jgi:cyclic-di-GMP phosphodiesterase TipF (flagellum assembly factor)